MASSVGQGLSKAYQFINPLSLFSFNPVINIKPKEKQALKEIGLTYFSFVFIDSGLEYSLSFLTHMRFKLTVKQQVEIIVFFSVIKICVSDLFVKGILPGKEIKYAFVGAFLTIPAFVLNGIIFTYWKNVEMLYVRLALYAYSSATVVPCLTTVVSKFGSTSQKGTILGTFISLESLASFFGPLVFAAAYWSLPPTVSFCIGGLLLTAPLYLIWKVKLQEVVQKAD